MKFDNDPNNRRVLLQIENISKLSKEGVRQAFYFIGKDLKQTSNDSILDKNKSGKTYLVRLGRTKRTHQASAPGEAPANITGNLRRSLGFEVRGSTQLEFGSRNGPPAAGVSPKQAVAEYSVYLELGTSKMAPRPYLKPSVEKNQGNTRQHFERELEKEFKR